MDSVHTQFSHSMSMDSVVTRRAISAALEVSVKDFRAKPGFDKAIKDNDSRTIERFKWILEAGEKAISDLDHFWRHMYRYSQDPDPKYLKVAVLPLRNCAAARPVYVTTLEQLWRWLRNRRQIYHHGVLLVCTKKTSFGDASPRPSPIPTWKIWIHDYTSPEAICRSALVASLFLVMNEFGFGMNDMHDLITAILGEKITEDDGLLPDVPQVNLYPDVIRKETQGALGAPTTCRARWHSMRSDSVLPTLFSTTLTKTIVFPSTFPPFKTTWQYMDIYKPHRSIPSSGSACGVWGSWNTDYTSWSCVAAIRDPEIADEFFAGLLDVFSIASGPVLTDLLSHWAEPMQYLYIIGLNDALLAVRDVLKVVHTIKYQNASDPETGSAHACLMYINYMEYHQRLVNRLRQEIEAFPSAWRVATNPVGTSTLVETCHSFEADLAKALTETKEVRTMIIQQYSLSQSRKTGLLTILASIFVPMSFVATFFGMNTKEINDSAWPLKYYVIAAASLTAVTLLVPLLGLQAFSTTAKLFGSSASLRRAIKWSWILPTFVMNLTADIMLTTLPEDNVHASVFAYVVVILCSTIGAMYVLQLYVAIHTVLRQKGSFLAFCKKEGTNILFYLFTAACFLINWYLQLFIELLPYVFYFGKIYWRYRQRDTGVRSSVH